MHKDTFNADFYITAATVIPILYLALTLQGQTYQDLVRIIFKKMAEGEKASVRSLRYWWSLLVAATLPGAAGLILITGFAGELSAVLTLI
jgi:hypothetical protein